MACSMKFFIKTLCVFFALIGFCAARPQARINRPLSVSSSDNPSFALHRRASADPSCPQGWLCNQLNCPSGVICPPGETCINFEGTIGCVPAGSSWCALNPTTFQGVGCYEGKCCHGNCYSEDSVCCQNSGIACEIGKSCLACKPGQTCSTGSTQCTGGSDGAKPTTTKSPGSVTTTSSGAGSSLPSPTHGFIPPSSGGGFDGCNAGTGDGDFQFMCEAICSFDYCVYPCRCTQPNGRVPAPPILRNPQLAYPAEGRNCSYYNLCLIYCRFFPETCPRGICSTRIDNKACQAEEIKEHGSALAMWKVVDCFNPAVLDIHSSGEPRWNEVFADDAWADAVAGIAPGQNFGREIANFFNLDEGSNCGTLVDKSGCEDFVQCDQSNFPAGYFIWNSLAQLHNNLYNLYNAMGGVAGSYSLDLGAFQTTFAPVVDDTFVEKLFLDFASLAFSLAFIPQWSTLLSRIQWVADNPIATNGFQSAVSATTQQGLTIIGQATIIGSSPLNAQNALGDAAARYTRAFAHTITQLASNLFNSSSASIDTLYKLVSHGQLLAVDNLPSDLALQDFLAKPFYAYMIPLAWGLSNLPVGVFIINTQASCAVHNNALNFRVSQDTANAGAACIDGTLWILAAALGEIPCDSDPHIVCSPLFSLPPGLTTLKDGQFGGLTKEDLIIGAVNGWKANGEKNGWATADPSNPSTIDNIFTHGVRAPGVVHIPVCDAETAYQNWRFTKKRDNWPCN